MANADWSQVKEILDAAIRRPAEDRAAFLDDACDGNANVRREVESLLSSFGRADGFMEDRAYDGTHSFEPMTKVLEEGRIIGHYEIVRPIGAGGMGQVYLARDELLKRFLAIKVLSRELLENDGQLDRFLREARSVSALNHPNICTVYEIDPASRPPFIAMEYIEGRTLAERLDNGALETGNVIDISLQIADGLAEAHDAGIIHRDIKPANIIIDKRGRAKIVDFGLAKSFSAAPEGQTLQQITHSGTIVGTVSYMSPEQVRGQPVDARTDIWTLGVVMCQMLTGKLPFAGDTMGDTIASIIKSEPEISPDAVSPKLLAIIRKALSKEKADRYESTRHLIADLHRIKDADRNGANLNYGTTIALPASTEGYPPALTGAQAQRSLSLRRYLAVVGILATIAVAASGFWYLTTAADNVPIESVAVMPIINGTGDAGSDYLSDGLTESLISRLSQLPRLSVKARSSVFRYKGKDLSLKQVGSELGVQAIINGRFLQSADQLTLYVELIDAATENVIWTRTYDRPATGVATLQSEVARDVVENLRQELTGADQRKVGQNYTDNAEAFQLYLKGRYYWDKRNEESYKVAVAAYEQAIALDPNYALAYAGLADCYLFREVGLGRDVAMPKAKEYALKALELDASLAEAHTTLAFVNANYDLDFPSGESGFKRAIELKPNYAIAHQFYGSLLAARGRTEEALAEMRKAVDLEPYSAAINWSLGLGLGFARRYEESIEQLQRTLQIQPNYALAEGNLIGMLIQTGRYNDAMALVERHLAIPERRDGALSNLAIIYAKSGRDTEARQTRDQLLREGKSQNSPYNLARLYAAFGDKDKAMEWLNKAVERRAFSVWFMRVDPLLDPLHDDPRFDELLRRIGLLNP